MLLDLFVCLNNQARVLPTQAAFRVSETGANFTTTVVTLEEQMRVVHLVWLDFLQHLCLGQVQQRHIDMLRPMLLTKSECLRRLYEPTVESSLSGDLSSCRPVDVE